MKLLTLLGSNLLRKPTRTSLTFVSLAIAFLLFMLLEAISDAFSGGVSLEGMDRIVIDSKYSMTDNLPLSYVQRIRSLDEVEQVTNMSWFGGYYMEPRNSFATYPVDPESYFDVFSEQTISAETLSRFRNIRVSAVASEALAARFGWNPGDAIHIVQDIFPLEDGSWTWQFELAGTFEYSGGLLLLINYDYFNEAVVGWAKDQIGWLVGRVADPTEVDTTIGMIDSMFENSSDPTRSTTEDEYRRQFASQVGDVGMIPSRKGTSSIVVVGIAGVVAVVVGLLSMSEGIKTALQETSHPYRVLVMRTGAMDEITGWLSAEEVNVLRGIDGMGDGMGTVSGELVVVVDLVTRETGRPGVAVARGVEASALEIRPELKLLAGRWFQPGRNELVVGVSAGDTYAGLDLGSSVSFRNRPWDVVGLFDAAGRAHDSEVWMDLPIAQAAFRREGVVSNARALLDADTDVAAVSERIRQEPRLRADLVLERDFYVRQSQASTGMLESFAYLIGAIMGLGAVVAAVNTMYSSVGARSVEIGTLRSLGFSNVPVVISVILEALLLALVGGVLAGAVVYLVTGSPAPR